MEKRTVTILCSGFGLGLYIPGLLAARRREEKNIPTCVDVKENRRDFIILSGHRLYIMEEYRTRTAPGTLNAEILYVGCDLPPS